MRRSTSNAIEALLQYAAVAGPIAAASRPIRSAAQSTADVDGNALAFVEQLHRPGGDAGLDLLAQQPVRRRGEVAADIDMIVELDPADAPSGIDEGSAGRRRLVEYPRS